MKLLKELLTESQKSNRQKVRQALEKAKVPDAASLKEAAKTGDWKRVKFTEQELVKVFRHFLRYLVQDYGNDRKEMIDYHIKKLVGLPYSQVVKKMPRGPGRGGWSDVMADIKIELEELAKKKAGVPLS